MLALLLILILSGGLVGALSGGVGGGDAAAVCIRAIRSAREASR